jgi:hypothetical protein
VGLGDAEAVVELDVVDHASRDRVRHALAPVGLGVDRVESADALRDPVDVGGLAASLSRLRT